MKSRDIRKFRELVEANKHWAYEVAFSFVGDSMAAYDISQQAFVKVWRNFKKWKPQTGFRAWLYAILRNLCYSHLERQRRRAETDIDSVPHLAAENTDAEKSALDEEMQRVVREAILKLSPEHQDVIVLVDLNGLKYREVSEILGIPVGTVMSRLYYARRHLAELLKDYWEGNL